MTTSEKKHSRKGWIFGLFALAIVATIVFFLPQILSRTFGKHWLEKRIAKETEARVAIDSITLSWFGPQEIRGFSLVGPRTTLSFSSFQTNANLWDLAQLKKLTKQTLFSLTTRADLKNCDISFHFKNQPPVQFSDIFLHLETTQDKLATLNIKGKSIENDQIGNFSALITIDPSVTSGKIEMKTIPVRGLDRLISLLNDQKPGMISALFGTSMDSTASFRLQEGVGPVSVNIRSNSTYIDFMGYVDKTIVTLKAPLNASLNVSEELSDYIFAHVNPLFISAARSQKPIKLTIEPNGFSFPLSLDKNKISIQKATLDLGILQVRNGATLSSLIGLLKFGSLLSVETMTVWFTPVNIRIFDGMAYTDRMDALLAETLQICSWGNINLVKEEIDMTLGITAQALQVALGIKGLPKSYVLPIPMRGPISDIQLDTAPAAAKIAALLAAEQGSGIGALLGSIVGIINSDEQRQIPRPKTPYPWQGKINVPTHSPKARGFENIKELFQQPTP